MNRLAVWAVAIAAIALALRLPGLDRRPMHADEAILADKFGTLLEQHHFTYDPHDYHGPVLEYLTLIPGALRRQWTYAALDEWTLRLVPVCAGVAVALTPFLFLSILGESGAVTAGLLIATASPMVFYSRDYIPETLLVLFTGLFVAALVHQRSMSAGLLGGIAIATKETAVIAIVAAVIVFPWPGLRNFLRFTAVLTVVTIALLGPSNVVAAVQPYWMRSVAAAGGHRHPWTFYAALLVKGTAPILLFALFGIKQNWRLAAFSGLLLTIYSVIPYKTPWCIVSMVWALSLIAGLGMRWCISRHRQLARFAFGLLVLISIEQSLRNDKLWAYAETSPEVVKIPEAVQHFAPNPQTWIGVYSTENVWPLPWYLRTYPNVRYSRQVTTASRVPTIVLVTPELEDSVARKLYEGRPPGERELYVPILDAGVAVRPGTLIRGYVAKSSWEAVQ